MYLHPWALEVLLKYWLSTSVLHSDRSQLLSNLHLIFDTLHMYLLFNNMDKMTLTFSSENQRTTDSTYCTDHKYTAHNS